MNKFLLISLILLAVIGIGFFMYKNRKSQQASSSASVDKAIAGIDPKKSDNGGIVYQIDKLKADLESAPTLGDRVEISRKIAQLEGTTTNNIANAARTAALAN